jgi:hypothetical protein
MRTESGGYRRDHLRALAQRVEVDAKEVRITGSKSPLLRTLVAASSAKKAGFGVPSFVPKWRAPRDSNSCLQIRILRCACTHDVAQRGCRTSWLPHREGAVFRRPDGQLYSTRRFFCVDKSAFNRACIRAGLKGVTQKTLQYTWVVRELEKGRSSNELAKLGAWTDQRAIARLKRFVCRGEETITRRLTKKEAAEYCRLSVDSFSRLCLVRPLALQPGVVRRSRDVRTHRTLSVLMPSVKAKRMTRRIAHGLMTNGRMPSASSRYDLVGRPPGHAAEEIGIKS